MAEAAVTNVLKFAVSFIRTKTAEKLQDGGLTDQKFRSWIVRELDDIKTKLDAMSRKDLSASISFLQQGIQRLNMSVDESCQSGDPGESPSTSTKSAQQLEDAVALADAIRNLKIESSERFDKAQKSFQEASKQATLAFHNASLTTEERILASKVRLASGILEHLEDPEIATSDCLQYLKELHDMPAIKEIFSVYVQGGVKSLFKKDSRKEIVESVTTLNLILADFISKFTKRRMAVFDWPTIECGKTVVHPIYCKDERPPNLRKITPPCMDIVGLKDDQFFIGSILTYMTLNKKGDPICFTKAKGGPQKLVKTTHELQPYCHPESIYHVVSMAVDDDDTLYVLTKEDGSFSWSVYSADGRNKDEITLEFIKSRSIAEICITNNKNIVIAERYPEYGGEVHICNRNGELINSFNPCEDPAPDYYRIRSVSVSSNDEIALITSKGNDFVKESYRLSTYTQDGQFQRTVKFHTSGDWNDTYRDIHYNHVTNTILGHVSSYADMSFIEFVSGETGALQRSYLLYSTNFPDMLFYHHRLVCHANGTMALVSKSHVIYLQNPPPSTWGEYFVAFRLVATRSMLSTLLSLN